MFAVIDKQKARSIVRQALDGLERADGGVGPLVILDELTLERAFGWVFFWDSRKHRETGDFIDSLAGNAPFIVDRRDGSLHETGTACPIEDYLEEYQKQRK